MAEAGNTEEAPLVKSIFVYPVKSCQGISVSQATLTSNGLRWDRLWMVVNSRGRMYTQRVEPKFALIRVEFPIEAFTQGWEPDKASFLVIKAEGMSTLKIPMVQPCAVADGVSVWGWSGSALDEGEEAAKWFSEFLGKTSRLVRFDEGIVEARCITKQATLSDYVSGHTIKFNDWYPFLMISQGSLDALNARLTEPVSINRFRPNFLVDGCEPFSEDLWNEIEISEFVFMGGELCVRCKVPTVNQETAEMGSEPNETLMKFRSDKVLVPSKEKHQGWIYMGNMMVCKNYTPENGKSKAIKVGDTVHVLKMVSSYDECVI